MPESTNSPDQTVTSKHRYDERQSEGNRFAKPAWGNALNTLLNQTPDVISRFDTEGRYQYVNAAIRRIWNLEPADVVGKSPRDLGIPEECCRFWDDGLHRVIESGESYSAEWDFESAAGRRVFHCQFYPDVNAAGHVESVLCVCRDITEHRLSEERYRTLFERMLEGFALHEMIFDAQGKPSDYRFLAANPAFETLTGLKAEDLIGKRVREVLPNLEQVWIDKYGKVVLTGEPHRFEEYQRGLDKHFEVMAFRPEAGRFACIFRDISERKRAEEERRRLETQMQQAQKLESLGILAGGIAHDFNNLLMSILGNADLALQDISPVSPVRPMLEDILHTGRRATDLCRQMLAYSGRGRFVTQHLNVTELIDEMTHMLEVSISKRAILRYSLCRKLPSVEADVSQIRQVIMNMVVNASEAIGERSGVISITTGVMACDTAYFQSTQLDEKLAEGNYVYIEVSDTGCGIASDAIKRIFDPFYTTKFTGRGLGLAAVLGIVRGHKGAIKVYSEQSHGTTFKVLLPALNVPGERLVSPPQALTRWQGTGTLLLVDDEDTVRALGKRMLERLGFSVLLASDGRDAVSLYQEHGENIRGVILDLTMPHMDGAETFRELRRLDSNACVIMTSGYNEQDVVNRFSGKGLAGFMQKPYSVQQLVKVLQNALPE